MRGKWWLRRKSRIVWLCLAVGWGGRCIRFHYRYSVIFRFVSITFKVKMLVLQHSVILESGLVVELSVVDELP